MKIRELLRTPLFASLLCAVLGVFVDALGDKRRNRRWDSEDQYDQWR